MNDKIAQEIILFISKTRDIPVNELSLDTDFAKDLGIDSLDMMELVFEFEDKYGLNLTCSPAEVLTIRDLATILNKSVDKNKSVV